METAPAIVVDHLCIAFGRELVAVQDLSFSIAAGKTLAIVGESGSGKTVTALALMGLLPKTATWAGKIRFNNANITSASAEAEWQNIRGKVAAMIFQGSGSALDPVMKVGRQLAKAIRVNAGLSGAEARIAAIDWLRKVQIPLPEKCYDKYPHQLSAEQKQRLMIAIAMSAHPALLIADEPTIALDLIAQAELVQLLKQLQSESGTALILITRYLSLAAAMGDDVLVMRNGEVLESSPPAQVVADFKPETTFQKPSNEILLKVRHLRVWFPTDTDWLGTPLSFLKAVEDVSFDLHHGEVLGIVGESGCGKSTIRRAIMGLTEVESGQMELEGKDLVHMSAGDRGSTLRQVQMIFQESYSSLNPRFTVGETIMEPLLVHSIVPRKEVRREAARITDMVHLPADALQRYPHQFSSEQRQRIGIARAIALRPKLIICDESFSDLDLSAQAQILNLLKDLQAELKLSYLFISHDLNMVRYISDRVLVMRAGKIIERGDADKVLKHPSEDYTKKLVAAVPFF